MLQCVCYWTVSDVPTEAIGVPITGLTIQGVKFDGRHLTPVEFHDPTAQELPLCYLAFVKEVRLS